MSLPSQKTIDQYLEDLEAGERQREKIVLAITQPVYQRNQNVVQAEKAGDALKKQQHLRSVAEYDEIIAGKIKEILDGKPVEPYEF